MLQFLALLLLSSPAGSSVDNAISLYEMGDIPGAILQLEDLLKNGTLSTDEELRAWNRLGSAYYAMGNIDNARYAYSRLLVLDVYYDLGPRANPRLRELLAQVRDSTIATAMVRSEPGGALVTLDDDLMGVTPLLIEGLVGGKSYNISVYQVGFETGSFVLTAQPGFNHMLEFALEAPGSTLMATATEAVGSDESITSPLLAENPVTNPIESGQGAVTHVETQPVASSGGSVTAPRTTEELIAALTQSGHGIDMTTIAGSGSLQSESSQQETVYAGSSGPSSRIGLGESGLPVRAEQTVGHVMIFSDVGQQTVESVNPDGGYSSRSGDEIMEVLTAKQDQVRYIFNKHLRTDPLLAGTVEVEMLIQPSGRVTDVAILSSTMYNHAFELELTRAIATWRFGSVDENEGPLVLQFPFNFQ
ncbi:MAG: AgmX/PglI C-terminal domain-containing protein [Candidatus Fermentibacteraceae bacterium]